MATTKNLTHHASSQCKVVIADNGDITFISYATPVIIAEKVADDDDDFFYVHCTGTYSQTTRRQIGWFLKEYFGDLAYADMKESAECGNVFFVQSRHAMYW